MDDNYTAHLVKMFFEYGKRGFDYDDLSKLVKKLHEQNKSLQAENQRLMEALRHNCRYGPVGE